MFQSLCPVSSALQGTTWTRIAILSPPLLDLMMKTSLSVTTDEVWADKNLGINFNSLAVNIHASHTGVLCFFSWLKLMTCSFLPLLNLWCSGGGPNKYAPATPMRDVNSSFGFQLQCCFLPKALALNLERDAGTFGKSISSWGHVLSLFHSLFYFSFFSNIFKNSIFK